MLIVLVLAAVFFPLLQMLSGGLIASNEVRGTNKAVIIALKKMEDIKNTSFGLISSESKAAVSAEAGYSRRVIVTSTYTNLKDVQVMVYWFPGEGSESSITIETYVANF